MMRATFATMRRPHELNAIGVRRKAFHAVAAILLIGAFAGCSHAVRSATSASAPQQETELEWNARMKVVDDALTAWETVDSGVTYSESDLQESVQFFETTTGIRGDYGSWLGIMPSPGLREARSQWIAWHDTHRSELHLRDGGFAEHQPSPDSPALHERVQEIWLHHMKIIDDCVMFWKARAPGTSPHEPEELEEAMEFFARLTGVTGGKLSAIGPLPDESLEEAAVKWKDWYRSHHDRLTLNPASGAVEIR